MEIGLIVLGWIGLIVAAVLGALIALGVIPLGEYYEAHQEKKRRERRAREALGRSTGMRP